MVARSAKTTAAVGEESARNPRIIPDANALRSCATTRAIPDMVAPLRGSSLDSHEPWVPRRLVSHGYCCRRRYASQSLDMYNAPSQSMYRKSVFSPESPSFDAEAQSEQRVSQRDFHFSSACLSLLLCASALKNRLPVHTLRKTRPSCCGTRAPCPRHATTAPWRAPSFPNRARAARDRSRCPRARPPSRPDE